MAKEKELKKAPGRVIGRWKEEARAANPGASDQDLANIVNDMASKQGYDYTITPEKVRFKKQPAATRADAPKPAPPTAKAAPPRDQTDGALVEDLQAFVRLVGKDGAKDLLNAMIDRL